jgi:MFS family permease
MFSSPIGILFTTVALDLIGFGMVVPLMPLYARTFGVSPQAIAWLLASYSLMQFFFAPVWGRLSDRLGRRPVLLASMAGNVVALLAFATAQSFGQLLASRLIAGICTANISVASAYIADSTPGHLRSRGMGLIGAAFGLGFVLGPFFAGELSRFGLGAPPVAAAGLSLVNLALAAVRLPESLAVSARSEQGRRSGPWAILAQRWQVARAQPRLLPLLGLIFGHVFGFAMLEMALTLMVATRLGFGALQSGRLLAFVGVVLVLIQGGGVGRLSRRFGDPKLFCHGLLALGVGLLAVPLAAQGGLGLLLVALAVVAVGQGLIAPTGSALLSRSADAAHQGEVLGLAQSSSALARVFGPVVAGAAYQQLGDQAPFFLGGVVVLGASLVARHVVGSDDLGCGAPGSGSTGHKATKEGHPCRTHP